MQINNFMVKNFTAANKAISESTEQIFTCPPDIKVVVLIPCYNEALTIHKVVTDFKTALQGASIVVYDNNSTDDTRGQAEAAGARVLPRADARQRQRGAAHVPRHHRGFLYSGRWG